MTPAASRSPPTISRLASTSCAPQTAARASFRRWWSAKYFLVLAALVARRTKKISYIHLSKDNTNETDPTIIPFCPVAVSCRSASLSPGHPCPHVAFPPPGSWHGGSANPLGLYGLLHRLAHQQRRLWLYGLHGWRLSHLQRPARRCSSHDVAQRWRCAPRRALRRCPLREGGEHAQGHSLPV